MNKFAVGQIWQATIGGALRRLLVESVKDDGWKADFRFIDNDETACDIVRSQLSPDWKLIGVKDV